MYISILQCIYKCYNRYLTSNQVKENTMQINLHNVSANQFTNCTDSSVAINNENYTNNIIVNNTNIITCNISNIKNLQISDLDNIIANQPDLVIFGTSSQIVYPDSSIIKYLHSKNIGVEVMTIPALCRTFNFLVSEDRKISCLILF